MKKDCRSSFGFFGEVIASEITLEGFDFASDPALYLIGYFESEMAGYAKKYACFHQIQKQLSRQAPRSVCSAETLILVKGGAGSRLYKEAHLFGVTKLESRNCPLKVISPQMPIVFGIFGGKYSFQRTPVRSVEVAFVWRAAEYVRSLS
jgi:hypothetical protein